MKYLLAFMLVAVPALAVEPNMPDPALTPGVARDLTVDQICKTRWGKDHRAVTAKMKREVFRSYGINCTISGRAIAGVSRFPDRITLPVSDFLTSDAGSGSIFADPSVFEREGMATRANGSRSLFCHGTDAAKDIGALGYGLQMLRVNASRVSTEVVENETSRNFAVAHHVREYVRTEGLALVENATVSARFESRACPVPASTLGINGDLGPKGFVYRLEASTHGSKSSTSALPQCKEFEIDHLISRELGGADDVKNLWPQPYTGAWNAHMKDRLENRLHKEMCAGKLKLEETHQLLTDDWRKAFVKYFGEPK